MFISFLVSLLIYTVTLVFTGIDTKHTYRFFILFLYFISIACVVIPYLKFSLKKIHIHHILDNKELLSFVLIILLAEVVSFFSIQDYPYVSVGDGVRDAGLDALRIANGTITNFFGYGNYNGYGEIVPVIASFFYHIFGDSVLTYRIPGAIISCADTALLFLLLRFLTNRTTAMIGALTYVLFPLHMFFARVELVVIFDSFWTTLLLLTFYVWLRRKQLIDHIMLGTFIGLAANFHTAVRVVAMLLIGAVVLLDIRKRFGYVFLFLVFCLVGFGPLFLTSGSDNFFQAKRYVANTTSTLTINYEKSLMVWFHEGTTSRYPIHEPLLSMPLFLLFLLGIGYSFFLRQRGFYLFLLFLAFILPFTNSAITDWINADHRLMPLLPIAAIFIALGLQLITHKIQYPLFRKSIIGVFFLYLLIQTYQFFAFFPANADKTLKDYLSMHIINLVRTEGSPRELCLYVSPANEKNLDLMHYKEQYQYFLPNTKVTVKTDPAIADYEAYIFRQSCPSDYKKATNIHSIVCTNKKTNYCPANFIGNINIYTD